MPLVGLFEVRLDGIGKLAGLIYEDEVTNGGGLLLQSNRHLNGQEQKGGQKEDADPEAFGSGVFGVFAPGD